MSAIHKLNGGCRCEAPNINTPVVSVIVVVFRDCDELDRLITNLAPFRSSQVELIIIDGGSEDGTRELLSRRSNHIDFWTSEPDGGIYDAMNKGIIAARGEFILHINAGDSLLALPIAQLIIMAQAQVDVVCCRVLEDDVSLFKPRNDWLIRFDNTWHHQGTFYRRAAHLLYDPTYRVFGDFHHNQRLRKAKCSVESLPIVVATHRTDGISLRKGARHEIFRSIRSNFGVWHWVPAIARFQLLKLRTLVHHWLAGVRRSD